MEQLTRILTWNCRQAKSSSPVWDYFQELSPDIALLQEVTSIPNSVAKGFDVVHRHATSKKGTPQRFGSAVLVRGNIQQELALQSPFDWVNQELTNFTGNLLAYRVLVPHVLPLNIVGVYSPAWPVDRGRLAGIDVGSVKLILNRDVWVADLLLSALKRITPDPQEPWVIGGDFNLSETFDDWRGGPRGNREYLDRMEALGLTECLRWTRGRLTPTFRNTSNVAIIHQMDHLFVTKTLASRLTSCTTGTPERVFVPSLSDHLPIVADFSISEVSETGG